MTASLTINVRSEHWPVRGVFRISRDSFTHSQVVCVELRDGAVCGRGECEPHESDPSAVGVVMAQIAALEPKLRAGLSRAELAQLLPAGPARNAVDCALWDLEAKRAGRRVWDLIGLSMQSRPTAYTLGIDTPQAMAQSAARHAAWKLLKIKLGEAGGANIERVAAIRAARPDARLIVDANGAWTMEHLCSVTPALARLGVELIEQPLLAGRDAQLSQYRGPIPLCADESCLDSSSLPHVQGRYHYVNIKLDKTGGLTEALALVHAARSIDLGIMVGCMVGTSLAMAPATLVAQYAKFVDLDGPMLLDADRTPSIAYRDGTILPPVSELWG